MELEQLRLFLAAAEHGGFSPAARSLYTSHSTISRAVSALEEEFGVQLFVRKKQGVTLTRAGEMLLDDARCIVTMADRTIDKLKGLS